MFDDFCECYEAEVNVPGGTLRCSSLLFRRYAPRDPDSGSDLDLEWTY